MDHTLKKVNEVNTSNLEWKISNLTSLARPMVVENMQTVKMCDICSVIDHVIDICLTLQEE